MNSKISPANAKPDSTDKFKYRKYIHSSITTNKDFPITANYSVSRLTFHSLRIFQTGISNLLKNKNHLS